MSTRQGLSLHPYWNRWNAIVQRCYSENNKNYKDYGARGIGVHPDWHPNNPEAVANFVDWMEKKVYEYRKEHNKDPDMTKMRLIRTDVNKGFTPDNCILGERVESLQHRRHGRLSFDLVVQLRRFKRSNPKATLQLIQQTFAPKAAMSTISRALIGDGWANVNPVEKPIERYLCKQ